MKKLILSVLVVIMALSASLRAQDQPGTRDKNGCKDYQGISRFQGAIIHACSQINYGEFYLGLGEPVEKEFKNHGQFFKKYKAVRGKIYNIQYLLPQETGILKVYENYNNALTNAGFNLLYKEQNKNTCFYREDYYGGDSGPLLKGVDDFYGNKCDRNYYYLVYKGVKDSLDLYVVLFIGTDGDEIIVNQHVIETKPVELGLVNAENIAQNIALTGHSIFYDIHFDTGSAEIKATSDNQLKEIAKYLKDNPDKKFYIVGHTDNTGDFQTNMTLSLNRAKAVVNKLVSDYGVDASQLEAHGVADMCPITNNLTDGNKARNRRVEIVAR